MKLKLFIITIIIASFAMIGLLGGCGGGSNGNTEEPRDSTIALWDEFNITTTLTSYSNANVKADGQHARVYEDGGNIVGLTVAGNAITGHVGKIYLLPSTQNIAMSLYDISNSTNIDFTATSSNASIASVDYDTSYIHTVMLVKAHTVGTTRINITAEDGRETWTDVIVVASASDMPTFVE